MNKLAIRRENHAAIGKELVRSAKEDIKKERAKAAFRWVSLYVHNKEQYERIIKDATQKLERTLRQIAAIEAGEFTFNDLTGELCFEDTDLRN